MFGCGQMNIPSFVWLVIDDGAAPLTRGFCFFGGFVVDASDIAYRLLHAGFIG